MTWTFFFLCQPKEEIVPIYISFLHCFKLITTCQELSGAFHLVNKVLWDCSRWILWHKLLKAIWLQRLPLWKTPFGSYSFTQNSTFWVHQWWYGHLQIELGNMFQFAFYGNVKSTDWKCDKLNWNWKKSHLEWCGWGEVLVWLFMETTVMKANDEQMPKYKSIFKRTLRTYSIRNWDTIQIYVLIRKLTKMSHSDYCIVLHSSLLVLRWYIQLCCMVRKQPHQH